jgi:hypothetical protein
VRVRWIHDTSLATDAALFSIFHGFLELLVGPVMIGTRRALRGSCISMSFIRPQNNEIGYHQQSVVRKISLKQQGLYAIQTSHAEFQRG